VTVSIFSFPELVRIQKKVLSSDVARCKMCYFLSFCCAAQLPLSECDSTSSVFLSQEDYAARRRLYC
jgi:hypothetical protein